MFRLMAAELAALPAEEQKHDALAIAVAAAVATASATAAASDGKDETLVSALACAFTRLGLVTNTFQPGAQAVPATYQRCCWLLQIRSLMLAPWCAQ